MATALDIIKGALRKISALGTGESLSNEEAIHALEVLNDMMSIISVEGAGTYTEVKETFPTVNAQTIYTIGSGQDFDTELPTIITAAYFTQGDIDYTLKKMGEDLYSKISDKDIQGGYPSYFYYDSGYPIGRIYLYSAPTAGTITIYSRKPLTQFSSLNADFEFPEQYKSMLVYNLACWIASEYEREASPKVEQLANKTLKVIKAQNQRNNPSQSYILDIQDRQGRFTDYGNIYTGYT